MASYALTFLSLLLGVVFVFIGSLKLTPLINPEIHDHLVKEFVKCNDVFPFYKYTGWRPQTDNFRLTVGILELASGLLLAFLPVRIIKQLANLILLTIMIGAFYTHYALNDTFDQMLPSLMFVALLTLRLIMSRERTVKTTSPKRKHTSKKRD